MSCVFFCFRCHIFPLTKRGNACIIDTKCQIIYTIMKQKLFNCGLMLLKDERSSRLYKVENLPDGTMKLIKMKYLSKPHSCIDVYPQCNLIVSSRTIYTLDEEVVISRTGADVKLYEAGENIWLVALDYGRENDMRYCIMWWNGKRKYEFAFGGELMMNERYLALYVKRDRFWSVYSLNGTLLLETKCCDGQEAELRGDFLLLHSVGNHSIYSLHRQHMYNMQESPIFSRQQLILCSKHDDFAICCGMNEVIKGCYQGKRMTFESAEQIDLVDFASLVCLKRGKKFYLYRFNGKPFATDICPQGADVVAINEKDKSLLVGADETYHLLKDF